MLLDTGELSYNIFCGVILNLQENYGNSTKKIFPYAVIFSLW